MPIQQRHRHVWIRGDRMQLLATLQSRAQREASFNQRQRGAWMAQCSKTIAPGSIVLDLGAGCGPYRALFNHCDYRAHDFGQYKGSSREAWKYTELDYICDARRLPVADATFDAIICTELLEHVPEPIAVMNEIGRLLRPGGRLFLSAPLGSGLHQLPFHFYGGFTPYFYRKFLPEAGLEIASIKPNCGLFRHLAQELNRSGNILAQRHFRWHPIRVALVLGFCILGPIWLARADDELSIEEFTVGYHVEAVRQ